MAHGLGGRRVLGLDRFASRFAAAGYAALAFDYRFFAESTGQPRDLVDVRCQLEDWRGSPEAFGLQGIPTRRGE